MPAMCKDLWVNVGMKKGKRINNTHKNKNMKLQLFRKTFNDTCTLGELHIDGVFFGFTLEDKYRGQLTSPSDKVQNQTAIPCGSYEVVVDHSAHFGKDLPHILNVPAFEGIRVHGGNTDADTCGCVLIGKETNNIDKIWNCAIVLQELIEKINSSSCCEIEVINFSEIV